MNATITKPRVSARVALANKKPAELAAREWSTLEELCKLHRFSYRTFRNAIKRGKLNGSNGLAKYGRIYRIHRLTFEREFMGVETRPQPPGEPLWSVERRDEMIGKEATSGRQRA